MTITMTAPLGTRVCTIDDLEVERGRAALIAGEQLALFLLANGDIHAVSNLDPYSGAHVMSRGIVGTHEDAPTIASPMYKHVFDLRTGACLDTQGKPYRALDVWQVFRCGDDVHVLPPTAGTELAGTETAAGSAAGTAGSKAAA